MHGWHTVKTWSTTQAIVAMSSGESELYSLTKGAAQALGLMALAANFGVCLESRVHTDASATLGIDSGVCMYNSGIYMYRIDCYNIVRKRVT